MNEIEQAMSSSVVNTNSLIELEAQRVLAQVQGQVLMAKKYPRDEHLAFANIMKACERKTLAEGAIYTYPRGGSQVEGPSIRLAECYALNHFRQTFGGMKRDEAG